MNTFGLTRGQYKCVNRRVGQGGLTLLTVTRKRSKEDLRYYVDGLRIR